ncbi:MAG: rhombotail lipoprotein [Cellvibrionaceae bacterium]|jgi:rhombotail lipoprotein
MNKYNFLSLRGLPWLLVMLSLIGCVSQQVNTKSSVMEYLYPNSSDTYETPSIPSFKLPLRVGVAFVPASRQSSSTHNFWTGRSYSGLISEAKKSEILEDVSENFRGLDFVSSIEVIPTTYLTPGGGFSNLSQIKTMYGIDVIALVSYDQVQFTDEGMLSLSYWTIVGAYVISGEKNDTNTLMDTVVYDISSKKLLFRAPGTSQISGKSTPINLSEELRADSIQGFEQAAVNMAANLKTQLASFKKRIKENPSQVQITHREGYGGGGGIQWKFLLILAGLAILKVAKG